MFTEFFVEEPVLVPVPATGFKNGIQFLGKRGIKIVSVCEPVSCSEILCNHGKRDRRMPLSWLTIVGNYE